MKKILFLTFLILPICALATDMCARDDTMVMILDRNIASISNNSNVPEWMWHITFPYGHIAGETTCLSVAESLGRTSAPGSYYGTGEYANTFITAEPGLIGTDINGNERKYCWCRMTHPFTSRWVLGGANNGLSGCKNGCVCCPSVCSFFLSRTGNAGLRDLFDSVGL